MRYRLWTIAILVVFLVLLRLSVFAVDRTEFVYVTQFGKPVATYDGKDEAGLHTCWPWPIQSVQRLDRRLQLFDLPATELLTRDTRGETIDKTLTIDGYVCWRIPDKEGVDRFIRTVGTPEQARAILWQRISSRLGAEIGTMKMDDLISVVPPEQVAERGDRLRRRLLEEPVSGRGGASEGASLKDHARQAYGIEIVDIRLRRANYPEQVQRAIFDRIISERNKKVADYQSEGDQLAANIRSEAERDARQIRAGARAREEELKGQARTEADQIRNEAHAKDPEFYAFLKKLEEYQRILGDNKTVLLLSSHRDLFDLLFNPPKPGNGMSKPMASQITPKETPRKGER